MRAYRRARGRSPHTGRSRPASNRARRSYVNRKTLGIRMQQNVRARDLFSLALAHAAHHVAHHSAHLAAAAAAGHVASGDPVIAAQEASLGSPAYAAGAELMFLEDR